MDLMEFSKKRTDAESEIRKILNDLSIEFEIALDVDIQFIEGSATGDKPKRRFSSVMIRGVL